MLIFVTKSVTPIKMTQQSYILNYKVERVLGTGGMGTVYLAKHTKIDRKVAIKALHPNLARDMGIRARFKNEASLMANLSHPNIVGLHDYVESAEGVFLLMEYVEGTTLDHYIRNVSGPIAGEKALEIFVQILEGVEYAHQKGIVHRDIKPANIMLTQEGGVKILDFGIAKNIDTDERIYTQAGMKIGTIYYMSPEQVLAKPVDNRTDIYSLGILLFEMLTGHNPFEALTSEYEISHQIVNEPLPKLRDFYPNVSPNFQQIIEKATAKRLEARFRTTAEFLEALKAMPEAGNDTETNPEPDHKTKEWNLKTQQTGEGKTKDTQFQSNSAISVALQEPKHQREPEIVIFENAFGVITNKRLTYQQGKDYFEKGKPENISLRKITHIELRTHKETATGVFFLIPAVLLPIFYFGIIAFVIASFLISLSGLCFTHFPSVHITKTDGKKITMRDWAWHYRSASEFVITLRHQVRNAEVQ
jgi:serine/threonine protein kinase